MKIKIDMPKNFEKQIEAAYKDQLKKEGVPITCPTCDKKITVKKSKPKCKYCGTTFDFQF